MGFCQRGNIPYVAKICNEVTGTELDKGVTFLTHKAC